LGVIPRAAVVEEYGVGIHYGGRGGGEAGLHSLNTKFAPGMNAISQRRREG